MINAYEVELRITNKNTRADRMVTRTEHAYGVLDAVAQALYNQSAQPDMGSSGDEDMKIMHVGPPKDDILKESQALAAAVSHALSRIGTKVKA